MPNSARSQLRFRSANPPRPLPLALLLVCLLLLSPLMEASGQAAPAGAVPASGALIDAWPAPRAELLLVGTFHFSGSTGDAYQPAFHVNILSPERQKQVEEVVARLEAFGPTKVAVEVGVARQAMLDSLYQEYLDDRLELRANEIFQLGFRLARRLGHDRLYAIDAERNFLFFDLEGFPERMDEADGLDPEWRAAYARLYRHEDSLKVVQTLREHLVHTNTPERILAGHGHYHLQWFKLEEDGDYFGADFTTGWYNRNLRIFRNLQRITEEPCERILVVIGSGHVPILRLAAQSSPEYRLVEVSDFLGVEPVAARDEACVSDS
jgi:hypothetical protein